MVLKKPLALLEQPSLETELSAILSSSKLMYAWMPESGTGGER